MRWLTRRRCAESGYGDAGSNVWDFYRNRRKTPESIMNEIMTVGKINLGGYWEWGIKN